MGGVRSFDHVGVVVDDLDAVTKFFLDLGFEREDLVPLEGEWMDKIVGLDGVRAELVVVKAPDGSGRLELTKYHTPADEEGVRPALSNRLGFRHIAYAVQDLDTIVDGLRDKKVDLVGDVVNYEDTYRLCYVRGPEGLIVEFAEQIRSGQA
jgi:catechol 2,3-dioxygenase-like lactoylglutathione lyase family enzyme